MRDDTQQGEDARIAGGLGGVVGQLANGTAELAGPLVHFAHHGIEVRQFFPLGVDGGGPLLATHRFLHGGEALLRIGQRTGLGDRLGGIADIGSSRFPRGVGRVFGNRLGKDREDPGIFRNRLLLARVVGRLVLQGFFQQLDLRLGFEGEILDRSHIGDLHRGRGIDRNDHRATQQQRTAPQRLFHHDRLPLGLA